MLPRKSLYYLGHKSGIPVYNPQNIHIGYTTGTCARPNGNRDSIGSIQIGWTDPETHFWATGYGVHIPGFGIKWTECIQQ